MSKVQVRDYLCGLARWVEGVVDGTDIILQEQLLCDIGYVFTVACDRISNICVLRNRDNSPFVEQNSLPPVLPKELVQTKPRDFLRMVCEYSYRLEHFFSDDDIVDLIADEQKALILQYRTDDSLKLAIDSSPDQRSGNTSFAEAWSVLGDDGYQNLNAFCGGLATLFPGTCSVESDFSVLRWEKDSFRKSLSDFGLEAILQAKQFLKMQQI